MVNHDMIHEFGPQGTVLHWTTQFCEEAIETGDWFDQSFKSMEDIPVHSYHHGHVKKLELFMKAVEPGAWQRGGWDGFESMMEMVVLVVEVFH